MRRVGQTRRRDLAEQPIVEALKAVGADVTRVSGKGAPDLLVRFRGQLHGFEVKSWNGKRTKAQEQTRWPIIRSVADAYQAIGLEG